MDELCNLNSCIGVKDCLICDHYLSTSCPHCHAKERFQRREVLLWAPSVFLLLPPLLYHLLWDESENETYRLPEAVANNGKLSKQMEKKNLCRSGDALMTMSKAVAVEINLPKFRTSTTLVWLDAGGENTFLMPSWHHSVKKSAII